MSHQRLLNDQRTLDETLESAKPQICCCHAHFVSWSGLLDYLWFHWITTDLIVAVQQQSLVPAIRKAIYNGHIPLRHSCPSMSKGRRSDGAWVRTWLSRFLVQEWRKWGSHPTTLSKSVWFPYATLFLIFVGVSGINLGRYDTAGVTWILHQCIHVWDDLAVSGRVFPLNVDMLKYLKTRP